MGHALPPSEERSAFSRPLPPSAIGGTDPVPVRGHRRATVARPSSGASVRRMAGGVLGGAASNLVNRRRRGRGLVLKGLRSAGVGGYPVTWPSADRGDRAAAGEPWERRVQARS